MRDTGKKKGGKLRNVYAYAFFLQELQKWKIRKEENLYIDASLCQSQSPLNVVIHPVAEVLLMAV